MGLFSKRKSQDYHGFARYTEELSRAQNSPNSAASVQRAQSLSGASQAALAALQMHQKPSNPPSGVASRQPSDRSNARANSLGGYRRSNSMQSYTYTPRASYVAGPSQSPLQGQRAPSLRSNSLTGSVRSGPRRNFASQPVFPEEEEGQFEGDNDDVIITTKTTKVLDSQGRTRSITTETVRHMPDGSNVIETKTTNLSRAGSRNNSLQGPPSHLQHANSYNLNKIDEDLHDFDYTYLDHVTPAASAPKSPVYAGPKVSKGAARSPVRTEARADSLSSAQSPHRLKSILKSGPNAATAAAAVATVSAASKNDSKSVENVPKNVPKAAISRPATHKSPPRALQPAPEFEPSHRLGSMTSNGTSIKFLDKVETIPHYSDNYKEISRDVKHKKEQAMQDNVDLYSKALQVASEKVYGSPVAPVSPEFRETPEAEDAHEFAAKNSEKKLKNDQKLSKVEASGVSRNYVYTNHHKDFSVRSMRDGNVDEHHLTRKERAREEKRQLKEEEKEHAERVKLAEKQRKHEEKAEKEAEKQRKQEEKEKEEKEEKEAKRREKKSFSLFKRNKRRDSAGGSSLGSSEAKKTASNENAVWSPSIENVPGTPKPVYPVSTSGNSVKDGIVEPVSSKSDLPNLALPVASVSQNDQASNSPAESSPGPGLLSKSESEYFLARSRTYDEDDDEFVDVPDNLADDGEADKRISVIPLLDPESSPKKLNNPVQQPVVSLDPVAQSPLQTPVQDPVPVFESPESGKSPGSADVKHLPDSLDPGHTSSEFLVIDEIPAEEGKAEELPTLVSGQNGVPEVLKNSDKHVFGPRAVGLPDENPAESSAENSASKAAHPASKTALKKKASYNLESLYKGRSAAEPSNQDDHNGSDTSKSFVVVDQNVNTTSEDPKAPLAVPLGNENHGAVVANVANVATVDAVDAGHNSNALNVNADQAQLGNEIASDIQTERRKSDSDVKSKSKKKASKFKKVIEKYFISSYSR